MDKQPILYIPEFAPSIAILQSIFEAFPYPLILTDFDGRVLLANQAVAKLTSYSQEELLNFESVANLYYEKEARSHIIDKLQGQNTIKDEKILLRKKDGQPYPVLLSLKTIQCEDETYIVGTIDDPSAEHKINKEISGILLDDSGREERDPHKRLVKSEERLELALSGADLGLWDWDIQSDRVIINDRWASMLGYHVSEVAGHLSSREMMIHPEDKKRRMTALTNHLSGKTPFYAAEYRIKTKRGTWRWVLDRGKITRREKDGTPLRMTGTHLDIHYRKEAERKLVKMKNSLQRSNYGLKQFAYIVSHNLKSPVNNITSLLSLLELDKINADDKVLIKKINQLTSTLGDTLDDLEKIISVSDGSTSDELIILNFEKVIESVLVTLGPEVEESKAKFTFDLDVTQIRYSKSALFSILLNLISNAIKYRSPDKSPEVKISTRLDNSQVLLSVSDNGMGIDLKSHGHNLFTLYKRFHDHVEGKGMGLFLVKSQVESLGGTIEVSSQPGKGTTFIVRFSGEAFGN